MYGEPVFCACHVLAAFILIMNRTCTIKHNKAVYSAAAAELRTDHIALLDICCKGWRQTAFRHT